VRELVGQGALSCQSGLIPLHQRIDRLHRGPEFLVPPPVHQRAGVPDIEQMHIVREFVQRPQAAADGQPQRERDDRQQPQARLRDLFGNILGQFVALAQ
jgi:hypothetical protein